MTSVPTALQKAASALHQRYPTLGPEAVVAFFCIATNDGIPMPSLAQEVGLEEGTLKTHLIQLVTQPSGALVRVLNPTTEPTIVLTPAGKAVVDSIEQSMAG